MLSGKQQALAAVMRQDWTDFAKTGVPGRPGAWPKFGPDGPATLSLVPPRPQVETDYAAEHQCGFWAAVAGGA